MRKYTTLSALRRGEVIDLEGIKLRMDEGQLEPGDLYVAERNTGPRLLTARVVDRRNGWVRPTCGAYSFDIPECVKIVEA